MRRFLGSCASAVPALRHLSPNTHTTKEIGEILEFRSEIRNVERKAKQCMLDPHHELPSIPSVEGSEQGVVPPEQRLKSGKLKRVGNILFVRCTDFPFKYGWELCDVLRRLRIEYRDQLVIHPDTPYIRALLFRVRHIVAIDMLSTDEAKKIIGVPSHITFRDMQKMLPENFGRMYIAQSPYMESRMKFSMLRRMRLKDIFHRDQLELKLLREKKAAKQQLKGQRPSAE